ncbi:hypothetical protein Q1695_006434 [Nippostrongylus brasiliensis]|nr:hypothetical protein Q1695_006434 [Nippostrongylus brasiliensis]
MTDRSPLLEHAEDDGAKGGQKVLEKSRKKERKIADGGSDKNKKQNEKKRGTPLEEDENEKRAAAKGDAPIKGEKPATKGLTPPREDDFMAVLAVDFTKEDKDSGSKEHTAKEKRETPALSSASISAMQEKFLFFDKTQWERTRFADEANAKLVSKELLEKVNLLKTQEFDQDGKETQLIGEARQSMAVRGEYLNEIPKTIIILLVVELILSIACAVIWCLFGDNPITPMILAVLNMLIVFFLILACISVEFFRHQVRREDNKSETRFFVPYVWRFTHFTAPVSLCMQLNFHQLPPQNDVLLVITKLKNSSQKCHGNTSKSMRLHVCGCEAVLNNSGDTSMNSMQHFHN